MRLRIDLAYDGSDFKGWARQPGLRTVQDELETALATVLRVPQVAVVCAGRTDTGVHARDQVVHLDVAPDSLAAAAGRDARTLTEALLRRLNGLLPPDVRVHGVSEVPPEFDARFSPLWRRYAYRVADRPALVDPLTRGHVLTWPQPLDVAAMDRAATPLLGEQDFAAFCRRREGATTVRALLDLHWERDPGGLAVATVRADAFCHNMVRSLIGCLLAVGDGRRPETWPVERLAAGVRHPAVLVAPAHGLTLEEVRYPPLDALGQRAEQTRNVRGTPHG